MNQIGWKDLLRPAAHGLAAGCFWLADAIDWVRARLPQRKPRRLVDLTREERFLMIGVINAGTIRRD